MPDQDTFFSEKLPFSQQQEIDRLCSEFEVQWRKGEWPRIEDYLAKVASPLVSLLLKELISFEVDLRRDAGEDVRIDEYRQRFPKHWDAVDAGWAMIANRAQCKPGPASTQDFSRDHDVDTGGNQEDAQRTQPLPIPDMIGRYKVLRKLGEGAFGRVFLAHDTQLQRDVALKLPGRKRLSSVTNLDAFLQEARAAARFKHRGLVVVHDVQQDGDDVYIVQEYIDGQDLSGWARDNNPSPERIVVLIKEVVEAVGFAHQHDLVHRDLKPANLLVDRQGHPHVADFGLALNESVQRLRKGEVCGTPAYMSPEQVRGLTHVLDGRSDLWSVGVILYELLTGRRPFGGATHSEVFEEVKRRDPKPPRQIKPEIPGELERICLKCLAKRQTDRYASAAELLEDLEEWSRQPSTVTVASRPRGLEAAAGASETEQQGASSTVTPSDTKSDKQQVVRIVPKGLRSFDEHDTDFFLELLPGARDRDGLPESIRFWKRRIEETDPDKTFRVGLIYGPSGCGKSSLVKAGLLPRLAPHVVPVYLEATPEDTELRLLKGLRRRFSEIPDTLALPDVLAGIREGMWVPESTKVCVVLDQFEQWLHARRGEQDTQLVQALCHCDGGRLHSVALVRDDFWVAASRFMQDLEVDLVQGKNMALVDLFNPLHARKVLAAFGRAYGRLPEGPVELSPEQELFLDRAVDGLAQDGKIICVRLALFAHMLEGRPWTTETLAQVGGTEGLGVTFLEETFTAKTSPPTHRLHAKAAQAVLKALLPDVGTDIKGQMQPAERLLECSGYAARPDNFRDLLQILNSELRLITPTEPGEAEAGATEAAPAATERQFYQLTHDYLVPSLRNWLTRKHKETRRGRAERCLAERSAFWNAKPENRQLPSFIEFVNIRALTKSRNWSESERKMMMQASWIREWRPLIAVLLVLLLAWAGFETHGRVRAGLVLTADPTVLPSAMAQLSSWQLWARQYLRNVAELETNNDDERREGLHARLALAHLTGAFDPELVNAMYARGIPYLGVVRDVLQPHCDQLAASLWDTMHNASETEWKRFRAGLALAAYANDSDQWNDADFALMAGHSLKENVIHQPLLWQYLRPVGLKLIPALEKLLTQQGLPESQQIGAANALAVFAHADHARLARLLSMANTVQYPILYPLVSNCPDKTAKNVLSGLVARQPADNLPQKDRVALGQQRAGAAISLLRLGEVAKSHEAFQIQDDPESLTQFVHRCKDRSVTTKELVNSLQSAKDVHSRFGLLLTLGDYPLAEIDDSQRDGLVKELTEVYGSDPSSAVHGATGWLLRKWGFGEEVAKVDHTPLPYDDTGNRKWYVLEVSPRSADATGLFSNIGGGLPKADEKIYFTFVVFPPGEYWMGSPEDQAGRSTDEHLHRVKLTRPLAVSMHEVTWAQYDPLDGGQTHRAWERQFKKKLSPADPAFGINWFEALTYCRWLTVQAGQAETAQCYGDPRSLPKDAEEHPQEWPVHLERPGFRLPTEAEWEYTCRAGMGTAFSFGSDLKLLTGYAWFQGNSEQWSHTVGQLRPNLRGLSDVHGNLSEWCHDWYGTDLSDSAEDPLGAGAGSNRVSRGGCWFGASSRCRSADRGRIRPGNRNDYLGFRVAAVPSASPASPASGAESGSR